MNYLLQPDYVYFLGHPWAKQLSVLSYFKNKYEHHTVHHQAKGLIGYRSCVCNAKKQLHRQHRVQWLSGIRKKRLVNMAKNFSEKFDASRNTQE